MQIRNLPQVAEVMPIKLKMTNCQSATDIIAMHGVDKDMFLMFRDYVIVQGSMADFKEDASGALVGDKIAARYGWKVGSNVVLAELDGISFNVSGIFTTNGSADDFIILTGRRFLQEADDEQGISNRVMVKLVDGADPAAVSRAIDDLPLTIDTTTQPEEVFLSASMDQLADIVKVSKLVILVIGFVILIAVGNAISMATRERTREFGVLRTIGYQKNSIYTIVLLEGLLQAVFGALIGCGVVQFLFSANLVHSVSSCGFTVNLSAGPMVWVIGVGAVAVAAALGCTLPAFNASRLDVVAAIRSEE